MCRTVHDNAMAAGVVSTHTRARASAKGCAQIIFASVKCRMCVCARAGASGKLYLLACVYALVKLMTRCRVHVAHVDSAERATDSISICAGALVLRAQLIGWQRELLRARARESETQSALRGAILTSVVRLSCGSEGQSLKNLCTRRVARCHARTTN